MQKQKEKAIFFQLPYACPNTPAAVNIWVRNIAKAFVLVGFKPTVQYLCKKSFKPFIEDGVEFSSVSFP